MAYRPGILLGQIIKTSGFEGAVLVKIEKQFVDNIPELESVFLEIEGRPVPFFIAWSEYNGADLLKMAFDGYESVRKAEEFRGCNVFLTSSPKISAEKDEFEILKDYSLIGKDNALVGKIMDITDNAGQYLLTVISSERRELLIPLHEDLIIAIDSKKKTIRMDLPEGLTGINS